MAYTLADLQGEVYARGLKYLNDGGVDTARVTRWINDAMHYIDDQYDWPYLQATTTVVSAQSIADLRTALCVTDVANNNVLDPINRVDYREMYPNGASGGQAQWYLMTNQIFTAIPLNAGLVLTVDYIKIAPDLSAPTDEPLMPDRYRRAIIEYACARGYDDQINPLLAAQYRTAGDQIVAGMAQTLLLMQHQAPQDFVTGYGFDN